MAIYGGDFDMGYKETWGYDGTPILVVGDSPTYKVKNVVKTLDPNHFIYNSIIVPIKYYTNEYLIKNYNCKLPEDFNSTKDTFRYINAIDNWFLKWGLDTTKTDNLSRLDKLKEEIIDRDSNEFKYKIIVCIGDFAYFAVKAVLDRFGEGDLKKYPEVREGISGKIYDTIYSIKDLGDAFYKNSDIKEGNKDIYILPVLHNISNRCDDVLTIYNFIPKEVQERKRYINYFNFVAERLGEVLITVANKEEKYREYLYRIENTSV